MQLAKTCDMIALILVIIGGLNWGLVGLNPDYNVVELILGGVAGGWLMDIVYFLVGISAIYLIFAAKNLGRR